MSGGSTPDGAAGYRYYFDIFSGLSRGPVNEIREIRVGGKMCWQGSITDSSTVNIDAPNLFGGDGKEGGIQGPLQVLMGEPTQMPSGALATLIQAQGAPVTGFRRMVTTFFSGLISAVNPYPKPWSYRLRRSTAGWDGAVFEPGLAKIVMLGDPTVAEGDRYGPEMMGEVVVNVPFKHAAPVILSVPGRVITSLGSVEYYSGGGPERVLPDDLLKGVDYLPDGSARLYISPLYAESTIDVRYNYTAGGVPGFEIIPAKLVVPAVARTAYMTVSPPSGTILTDSAYVSVPNPFNVDLPIFFDATVEQLPGGSARLFVNPYLAGKAVHYRIRYSPAGGGGPFFQEGDGLVDKFSDPVFVAVAAPNGGKLIRVNWVADTRPILGSDNEIRVPRYVNWYNVEPDGSIIAIDDYEIEGHQARVSLQYKADVNAAAAIVPDREIHAMNPAHIILECYTNREWGRGLSRDLIDLPSFQVAAQQLFNEGFGLCILWSRRNSIMDFVQSVLDHIAAAVYTDRATAKLCIKLIRGDYDPNTLKVFDTTNGILSIKASRANTSSTIINEVVVKYRDPVLNRDRGVNVQNLASLQSGSFNTQTKEYPGLPTQQLARRVAQRDLRSFAAGLRRFEITMDRRGSELTPGGVMRLKDAARNIPVMVVRIATIKDGTLLDGTITLSVVQDVFTLPENSYVADQPNTWAPPNFTPCIGRHEVFEVPYFYLRRTMRTADFAVLEDDSAFIGTVAERASPYNSNYTIAVRDSAPTPDDVPLLADQLYCGYNP